jgi:methyl-accepting chemotaxis protein
MLKLNFKNVKLVRKIQASILLIALVSTVIAVSSFVEMGSTEDKKSVLFKDLLQPENKIYQMYNEFKEIKFVLSKIASPSFADAIDKNIQFITSEKTNVDSAFKFFSTREFDPKIKDEITAINKTWVNYKNVVIDAILSAGLMKDYEMASVITTTSGEEVAAEMERKFGEVQKYLSEKRDDLDVNMSDGLSFSKMIIIIGMLLGTIAFLISTFYIAPLITKPIHQFNAAFKSFAKGNYNVDLNVDSKDEFGEMKEQLIYFRDSQKEKIKAAVNISEGLFEKVNPASDDDELANSFNKEIETIQNLSNEITSITKASSEGNLSVRGATDKFRGGFKEIILGLNRMLDMVIVPINESSDALTVMATGDLTVSVKGDYQGDHQIMKNSINEVAQSLASALLEVSEAVSATASASTEISSSAEEMAAGAQEQSAQTSEVASSVEEMTKTIMENSKNASFAAETAKKAGEKAKRGGDVVHQTIDGMNRISQVVAKSADTVFTLGKNSDKIGEIVQVIDDIADQTNLLALNAAIEAARAGDQGRGFAVVADEVRKLAERTTKATKEIAMMIKQIQKDTTEAVSSMEEGTKEVEKGKKLVNEAGGVLEEIIDVAQKVSDTVVQVAAASEQQSSASEQISRNIEGISNVTRETSAGINQIAHAAEDLNKLTVNLQDLISRFKIDQKSISKYNVEQGRLAVRANGKLISRHE